MENKFVCADKFLKFLRNKLLRFLKFRDLHTRPSPIYSSAFWQGLS